MIWDQSKAPDGSPLKRGTVSSPAAFELDGEQQEYLLAVFDSPITIQRVFVELCENLNAAALLSDLASLEKETNAAEWTKTSLTDGQRRIGLNAKEQRAAHRLLVDRGFVEVDESRFPNAIAVRIRWDAIDEALRALAKLRAAEHPVPSTQ